MAGPVKACMLMSAGPLWRREKVGRLHLSTNSVSVSDEERHSNHGNCSPVHSLFNIAHQIKCVLLSAAWIFFPLPGFLLHSFCFFFFVPLAFRVVCRSALKVVSSRLSDVARDQCCATLCHADQLCITRIGSFQVASLTCLFEKALSLLSPASLSYFFSFCSTDREKLKVPCAAKYQCFPTRCASKSQFFMSFACTAFFQSAR